MNGIAPILNDNNIEKNNFLITFYYIDNNFPTAIKTDIQALYTNYHENKINFQIKFYDYNDLEGLYDDIEIPQNQITLNMIEGEKFVKKSVFHDDNDTDVETLVTTIKANSLKPIIEDKKELILALNVRYYKGENDINSKIKQEYSKGKRSNFWLLNNGINAVCEDYKIENTEELTITNFQIVNGGQTTKTLTRIVNDLPDDVQILMRLTKIKDKARTSKISMDIAVASNSQNAISSRDLHSGDRIQLKIFDHLNKVGIFYDKKDGEWATVIKRNYRNPHGKSPMHLKIKNINLGISYLSFYLQLPISTIGRHKLVFSDIYYSNIFDMNTNEDEQFYKLMLSYRISERVNEVRNEKYNNFEVLWNNYVNDVIVSLSALYFVKDFINNIQTIEDLTEKLSEINPIEYLNCNEKYFLNLDNSFDEYLLNQIRILQNILDVKKEAKMEYANEGWLPNDTNKWLKKDGTYKDIFKKTMTKLKQE